MMRKYRRSDASPVSGTTRGRGAVRAGVAQVAIDPIAQLEPVGGPLVRSGHRESGAVRTAPVRSGQQNRAAIDRAAAAPARRR